MLRAQSNYLRRFRICSSYFSEQRLVSASPHIARQHPVAVAVEDVVYAVHGRQLAEHGGTEGVLDAGRIDAALARPRNLAHHGDPDLADLAAAYAFGLARNHGFVDGNKRVAWLARLFLADNGFGLEFDPVDAIRTIEGAASGAVAEPELADWFRERLLVVNAGGDP